MRLVSAIAGASLALSLALAPSAAHAGPNGDPVCAFQPDGCLSEHAYTVRRGDWLWKISRQHIADHGLNTKDQRLVKRHADAIYARNRGVIGSSPNRLRPGMRLLLPTLDRQP